MRKLNILILFIALGVLAGCAMVGGGGGGEVVIIPSVLSLHPGGEITITVPWYEGATYQFEVLKDGNVEYTLQGTERVRTFKVRWWPWSVRVTVFIDGVVYGTDLFAPTIENESPIIYLPTLIGEGHDFGTEFEPLASYICHLNFRLDAWGVRRGVLDPDGDDWHIVSVTIQEKENAHETTVVTWPYQEGVWCVGGQNGYARGDPLENAFEFFPTWSGDVDANGTPYLPRSRSGWAYDPLHCAERNLAPSTSPKQKATMTIVVEDQYGAKTRAVFTFWVARKACT